MSADIDKAISRPLGVAKAIIGASIDSRAIYKKVVVLTGETKILQSRNGQWCFVACINLLSRIFGKLIIVLPEDVGNFEEQVRQLAASTWGLASVSVEKNYRNYPWNTAHAILNVGTEIVIKGVCTTINSDGWVARATNTDTLPPDVREPNPISALMAASIGTTEVFKRIFEVPEKKASLIRYVEYSLFEQSTSFSDIGPKLPDSINIPNTLLVGCGAIGNGIAWLLQRISLTGRLHLVDKQNYAEENFGTCILMEKNGWLGFEKAGRLGRLLKETTSLTITHEKVSIEEAASGQSIQNIDLILTALDRTDARRAAQFLWPLILVDGGINDVGAAVTQWRFDTYDRACMRCWFEEEVVDEKLIQARITGLDARSLEKLDRMLCDEDIARAHSSKQEWLRQSKKDGKTVCSVITEAALREKLGVDVDDKFRPSVPFVATAAAAMSFAETIKALLYPSVAFHGMVQVANLFLGVDETVLKLNRNPNANCQCVNQKELIRRIVSERRLRGIC